jgi:hypothetical protein
MLNIRDKMSPPCREKIIVTDRSQEKPSIITRTGGIRSCPGTTGIRVAGNPKSHYAN